MGVGPIPHWIHRFARIANGLNKMYGMIKQLGDSGKKAFADENKSLDNGRDRPYSNSDHLTPMRALE